MNAVQKYLTRTWISTEDMAVRWHLTPRRVRQMAHQIRGAVKVGRGRRATWILPADAADPRKKA
jgi:acyl-CoA synthetase (AMP-forming)/AMP-acid ligase II